MRPVMIAASVALLTPVIVFAQQRSAADAASQYRPEVVAAARRDVLPLHACYDQAPRHFWRQLHTMTLSVDGSGAVTNLAVAPTTPTTARFRDCLLPIVRSWHLTAPTSHTPISITYEIGEIRAAVERIASI